MNKENDSKKKDNSKKKNVSKKNSVDKIENINFLSKLNLETKLIILIVIDLILAYTFYLSGKIGVLSLFKSALLGVFGFGVFFIPILLGYYIYSVYKTGEFKINPIKLGFFTGAYFVLLMVLSSVFNSGKVTALDVFGKGYETSYILCIGFISTAISNLVCKYIGQGLAILLFLALTFVLIFLGLDRDINDIWDMVKNWFSKMLKVDEDEHYKDFYNTKKIKNEEINKRYNEQKAKELEFARLEEEKRVEEQKKALEQKEANKRAEAKMEIEEETFEIEEENEYLEEDLEEESDNMNEEYLKYMREKSAKKNRAVNNALEGKFAQEDTKKRYVQKNQRLRERELKPKKPAKFFKIEPIEQSQQEEVNQSKIVFNRDIFDVRKESAKLYEFVNEEKQKQDILYEETRRINEKLFNASINENDEQVGSFLEDYINAESAIHWVKGGNVLENNVPEQRQQSQYVNQQPTNINVNIQVNSEPSVDNEEAIKREKYLAKVAILDEVYNKVKHEIIDYYNDNTKDNFDFTKKPRVNKTPMNNEEPILEANKDEQTQEQPQQTNFVMQPSETNSTENESSKMLNPSVPNVQQNSGLTMASSQAILEARNQAMVEAKNQSNEGNQSKTVDLVKFREQRENNNFEDISQEITDELKEEIKGEVKEKILQEFVGRIVGNMSQEEKEEFLINMSKDGSSKTSTSNEPNQRTTEPSKYSSNNNVGTVQNNVPTQSSGNQNINIGNIQSQSYQQSPTVNQISEPNRDAERNIFEELRIDEYNSSLPKNQIQENTQKVVDDFADLHYNEYKGVDNDNRVVVNNNNIAENQQNVIKSDYETDFIDEYEQFEIDDIYNDDDFDLDEIESEYMELSQAKPKPKLTHIDTVASRNKPYVYPSIDILAKNNSPSKKMSESEVRENSELLEQTLGSFGVKATVMNVTQGPTVTRYEIQPGVGVKVSKIVGLTDDLALNLAAQGIRIEAPIPGKSAVGIEVPNLERESIFFRDILENPEFLEHESKIAVTLGKDISGQPIVTDIAKMPHVLVAGATGSGKSVCVNTIITSILYRAKPEECKLLMIDPKVVELSIYNGIPHLMIPVVTDPKKASAALQWAVSEMEQRYEYFAEASVRDLKGYNKHVVENNLGEKLPEVVIIVDELADLMMTAGKEVEESICRLAQKARAAGIYLIIATQRPSVDVITGLIKANIPSRIAFSVTSSIDSRTILDSVGAEKLLGRGDMLFKPYGSNEAIRVQGAFISDKEVENIVKHLKENSVVTYDESIIDAITSGGGTKGGISEDDNDDLLGEALQFFIERDKASVSMLQTRFKVGYNRAARIVDTLESAGYIGESDGSKGRKILITQSEFEELGL